MKNLTFCISLLLLLFTSCKKRHQETLPDTPGRAQHFYVKRILLTAPLIRDDYYFSYNAANQITAIDQKDYRRIKLTYSTDSLLTKAAFTYYDGKPQGYTDYFYTGKLLTKEIRYHVEEDNYGNSYTYKQTFEYGYASGRIGTIKAYNTSDALKATATVTHDEAGNPVSIKSSTGLQYTYQYAAAPYRLFPGNEVVYSCLYDFIALTHTLAFATPADINYYIPFTKEITGITQKSASGDIRMDMRYTYEKNGDGLITKLTMKNLREGDPSQYVFEYEKR